MTRPKGGGIQVMRGDGVPASGPSRHRRHGRQPRNLPRDARDAVSASRPPAFLIGSGGHCYMIPEIPALDPPHRREPLVTSRRAPLVTSRLDPAIASRQQTANDAIPISEHLMEKAKLWSTIR